MQWLRPEWLKLYDPAFVDEQLIGKVLVFVPQVQQLQVVLEGRMASEAAKKEAAAEAAVNQGSVERHHRGGGEVRGRPVAVPELEDPRGAGLDGGVDRVRDDLRNVEACPRRGVAGEALEDASRVELPQAVQ